MIHGLCSVVVNLTGFLVRVAVFGWLEGLFLIAQTSRLYGSSTNLTYS